MAFDNPSGDDYVLKPVWMMGCYSEADTNRKFPPEDPDYVLSNYVHGSMWGIVMDAQTGEVYNPTIDMEDKVTVLNPGQILTWDEVK